MMYSLVEIRPKAFNEFGWIVRFQDMPHDRKKSKIIPHSLGFLYYPTSWGKQKGFNTLKADMVKRHKQGIKELQESLALLEALEYQE